MQPRLPLTRLLLSQLTPKRPKSYTERKWLPHKKMTSQPSVDSKWVTWSKIVKTTSSTMFLWSSLPTVVPSGPKKWNWPLPKRLPTCCLAGTKQPAIKNLLCWKCPTSMTNSLLSSMIVCPMETMLLSLYNNKTSNPSTASKSLLPFWESPLSMTLSAKTSAG